jgi:hypothetical protein
MIITKPLKFIFSVLLITCFCKSSIAQKLNSAHADSVLNRSSKAVFLEIGGPGIFFSANYDTRFAPKPDGFGARLGLGYIYADNADFITVPVQINYLLGKRNSFLELGLGGTFLSFNNKNTSSSFSFVNNAKHNAIVLGTSTIGYRYQPVKGGFNFRAGVNPLFDSSTFVLFAGLSFGYCFR